MAHPEARVAAFLVVGGGAPEVLDEKKCQMIFGLGQILGVEGTKDWISVDANVEPLNQLDEELFAPDEVIDAFLFHAF
jgi:hypothetical protein